MCSCCNATYYGENQRQLFVRAFEGLGVAPLTGKFVKTPKKSAIFHHMLLDGHKTCFGQFFYTFKRKQCI